jgi:tRNA G18 (ribose-2'-O)-methylase SpoU
VRIERVAAADDARLADYRDLTDVALRRVLEPAGGLYMAESAKVIARALAAGHRPRSFLVQEKWLTDVEALAERHPDAPIYVVEPDIAEMVTGYAVHRGALAAMHRPPLARVADVVADARLVVVLEDIVDHTNVGAMFRAAAGLGADAVLVSPRCADPL